ncbi:MAG: ATP-binding protein [FCB group bacterium]|jgi:signal transduction histidine kinase|nr:ATP-binding protein [FCB group bacterium]
MMAGPSPYPAIRWYNTLIFRVLLFCAVLLFCLFAAVSFISQHYFNEVAYELEAQGIGVATQVSKLLKEGQTAAEIESMLDRQPGEKLELREWHSQGRPDPIQYGVSANGRIYRLSQHLFTVNDREWVYTSEMTINPQTEFIQAFRNTYMAAVTLVFIITLLLMIFVINRALQPVSDLSQACAEIGRGKLQSVRVRNTAGEIRALEYTFNHMVDALREKEVVEANLRQAQRLSALGNLAAGVAHDVRNPLNAIKLISSHALDTLSDGSDCERTARQLRTIREEVDRIDEIVTRFLSLAKDRKLEPEPLRIDWLLQECLDLLRRDAEKREVRLIADLRAGDTVLMLDGEQWRRAALNVLINALEACPPGGRVRLFSRVTDSTCEVEVRDDGPGMSKDVLERAFEPYFTTKSTGTGLGLAITRGIVEEHGGRIDLSCATDQGCQVLITMPLEGKKV